MHTEPSPLAGVVVKLREGTRGPSGGDASGAEYHVDDWADRLFDGRSWQVMDGNPSCITYALRAGMTGLPHDDEVLGGQVDGLTFLAHVSEIEHQEASA